MLTKKLSNYDRSLFYGQPLLTLCAKMQTVIPTRPDSSRFDFSCPPPNLPFVSKTLVAGVTLHIATNPSLPLLDRFITFVMNLPPELCLYPAYGYRDWILLFKAPTFFIYIEKEGVVVSLMSLVKMISTEGDIILNIITTQADNSQVAGRPIKSLGDIMFVQVRLLDLICML